MEETHDKTGQLTGKELFEYLHTNKDRLIKAKKALPKFTEPVNYVPVVDAAVQKTSDNKAAGEAVTEIEDALQAKFVGNSCWWVDSYMDVGIEGCYDKTLRENKKNILHLKDHLYKIEAEIGDMQDAYAVQVSLRDLGLNMIGTTQCAVFVSDVKKEYDSKAFGRYKSGRQKQHSIGLYYVKLELAINDSDYKEEKAVWDKYYSKIINKDFVDSRGFFWAMLEIKIIEVSAVLFGANELTPTLEVSGKDNSASEPGQPTQDEPPKGTQKEAEPIDINNYLKTVKFF